MTKKERKQKTFKKSLKRSYVIAFVVLISFSAIALLPLSLIPIETVHTGGCHVGTVRVSLTLEGRERFDEVKADTQKRNKADEEFLKRNPGIAMGCSAGPTFELYRL